MGPEPASTVLTAEQEAIAVAFRRHTLLALDDCLYALQGGDGAVDLREGGYFGVGEESGGWVGY